MGKTFIISSAKGGVGKTTVAINLGVALARMKKKTVLIDGSITTPDVSLYLGIPFYVRTLNDLIKKEASINEVVFEHKSGLKVIPTSIHPEPSSEWLDTSKIGEVLEGLKSKKNHFIIIDSSAGLTTNTTDAMKSVDNIIVVTNPELAAVVNSYKTILAGKKLGISTYGVIINRIGRFKNELSEDEIKQIIGNDLPVIGKIPEHRSVPMATTHSASVLNKFPKSPVSKEFKKIAARITRRRRSRRKSRKRTLKKRTPSL